MERDYGPLINTQIDIEQGVNQFPEHYEIALRNFVYDLLKDVSVEDAAAAVNADFEEIAAASDPEMHETYNVVRHDILARIEREGAKKPWQRTLRRRVPIIVLVLLVIAYGGTRWYNATPVDQPLESKAGLVQRAAALHKVVRYQEYHPTNTRRGRWLVELLFWPIEPTENDIKGAGELAGIIIGGGQSLQAAGAACAVPTVSPSAEVSEATLALLDDVALHLQDRKTVWADAPVATVLSRVQARHPCR